MFAARAVPLSLALLAAACGEETDPCVLRVDCDIRDDACVEHAHAVVACMRGVEHPLPKIRTFTPEQYLELLAESAPTPEQQKADKYFGIGLELLSLLPPGWGPSATPTEVATPVIFYNWQDRMITMVIDGNGREFELSGLIYALVLADRDAEVGLEALFLEQAKTTDSNRALQTLLAGEGTFYSDLAFVQDSDYETVARNFSYEGGVQWARERFNDPSLSWNGAMAGFGWYYGGRLALKTYLASGPGGIDELYESTIDSTAHALQGSLSGFEGEAIGSLDAPLPDPPPGFLYRLQDSFGPALYYIHRVRSHDLPLSEEAERLVAGTWGGDRIVFAVDDVNERVAVIWQTANRAGELLAPVVVATDVETEQMFRALFSN